jgi:hypothetical protein
MHRLRRRLDFFERHHPFVGFHLEAVPAGHVELDSSDNMYAAGTLPPVVDQLTSRDGPQLGAQVSRVVPMGGLQPLGQPADRHG